MPSLPGGPGGKPMETLRDLFEHIVATFPARKELHAHEGRQGVAHR